VEAEPRVELGVSDDQPVLEQSHWGRFYKSVSSVT
jgi:hypothetical protein